MVRRLVLVGPLGVFDEAEPVADVWAQRPGELPGMACADPARFQAAVTAPEGEDPIEAEVLLLRAHEAAARLLWPLSDTGLAKRLPRIRGPVMLVWGEADRVVPFGYAAPVRLRAQWRGLHRAGVPAPATWPSSTRPDEVARRVLAFLES